MTYTKNAGITPGMTYKFKVEARNAAGLGDPSLEFKIIAASIPIPPTLTRDDANTTESQVALTWLPPTNDGDSAIIDYTIKWDQGVGLFVQAVSGIMTLSYI